MNLMRDWYGVRRLAPLPVVDTNGVNLQVLECTDCTRLSGAVHWYVNLRMFRVGFSICTSMPAPRRITLRWVGV